VGAALAAAVPLVGNAALRGRARARLRALKNANVSSAPVAQEEDDVERRRRIRRSAILWGGIAVAIYMAYIIAAVLRAWR